jgi:hypothetical protein
MNIPYLIKVAKTNKLSELVALIDTPPLDMNLAIWDSIDAGEIEVDEEKDRIKVVIPEEDIQPWQDPDLANKLIRTIQHYAKNDTNITRGRLNGYIKEPITDKGYPMHEYFMTLQALIDTGQVTEEIISVPGVKGKREPHKFAFLCLPENGEQNAEWNAKAVNKWIADSEKNKVK